MNSKSILIKERFDEIIGADLGIFQIIVPTKTDIVNKRIFNAWVPIPKRAYDTEGWIFYDGKIIASLYGLEISKIELKESPFEAIRRIAPAIPISFEVRSMKLLPEALSSTACFACELQGEMIPYYAVFRNMRPRFVKVYPFSGMSGLEDDIERLLIDEQIFVGDNRDRLKRVPFYKECFNL